MTQNNIIKKIFSYLLPFLVLVIQHVFINKIELHPGQAEHLFRFSSGVVTVLANHPFDAAVDDEHGTGAAGGHTAVKGPAIQSHTAPGRLADGVLLGMDGAHAMLRNGSIVMDHFLHQVTDIITMRQPLRGADVAGYEHLPVANDHASAAATVAGGPFSSCIRQIDKVFVP